MIEKVYVYIVYISEIGEDIDRIREKDVDKVRCKSEDEDILDFVYISERGGLRSDAPRHRGDDGATPAHSNQYSTCSYDKNNCAAAIIARLIAVAFCCDVYKNK